jgi:hypothetical protein
LKPKELENRRVTAPWRFDLQHRLNYLKVKMIGKDQVDEIGMPTSMLSYRLRAGKIAS